MKKTNGSRKGMMAILSLMLALMLTVTGGSMINTLNSGALVAQAESLVSASDPSPAIYVAEKTANSVVGVLTNTQTWTSTYGVQDQLISQGSGVVISEGGYILTNCHVIEDGTAYQILMPSGEKVDAILCGSDDSMDLAVLKVDDEAAKQLIPVDIGDVEELKVGSTAIAIGNPGGETLANTVTAGIVSALERTSVSENNSSRSISYIQHDAAINSGNSGGGLFNYKGELIGINTLKMSGTSTSGANYEGLGFAIPVSTAYEIAQDLIQYGKVIRPALGVSVTNQEGPDSPLPSNAPASVCIREVTAGSAAEKAGLKQYDFIVGVNGQRVTTMTEMTSILDQFEVGDTISITVVRYNQVQPYQAQSSYSIFGYGYGYGYGYGDNSASSSSTAQLVVGGGYEEITVDLTLEELE